MAEPHKKSTQKLTPVEADEAAAETKKSRCPYCKQVLESAAEIACPHCGLPLRRRKRQRQVTSHGGQLAKFIVHQPGEKPQEHHLSKQVITVGRSPDNFIRFEQPYISGHHVRIEFASNGHTITDLNSTNGTRVNGLRLKPDAPQLLADKDIIRLSDARGNSIKLTYIAPSGFGWVADVNRARQTYHLENNVSTIGRGFDAHIILSHPAISWYHAKISKQENNQYLLEDAGTRGATFLNGAPLQKAQLLNPGDVIGIGPFNLIFQEDAQLTSFVAERNFSLEAANLEKSVYGKNWLGLRDSSRARKILRNIDIDINPREFVALVGGSGGGKSTLMKALIGLSPATGGSVLVNGDDLYKHIDVYRHLIGYVPQDDIIHRDLSVRQALRYAFQIRVPEQSAAEGETVIDNVLTRVDLTGHADTLVRNLSGGQRKRVSIAAELLADPWIFFLDEPTSGLDPGLEKMMMDTLRHLADEGRTIVLVTHAVNYIAQHCDQVAFMADGELAYYGPPNQAMAYFKVDNFPDIYTALSQFNSGSGQPADNSATQTEMAANWGERYRQSDLYETYILHRRSGEVARPVETKEVPLKESLRQQTQQFKVLAQRYLDLIRADRLSLWLLLAVMPLIALFLLLITGSNVLVGDSPEAIAAILDATGLYAIAADAQRVLFLMALTTTLLGIFGAGYEVIKEEAIYRRERMVNLQVEPYFASKFGVLLLFMGVQIALFLVILAVAVRFPRAGAVFWALPEFYITLLLTVMASIGLGLFISAAATSKDIVTYLILIVVLAQIVFSGAIFKLSAVTEPLSYLTITRWSLEALGISANIEALNQLGQVRVEDVLDSGRGQTTLIKDIPTTIDFYVNYRHNAVALISRWILLIGQTLIWSYLGMWQIRRKDNL